MPLPKEEAQKIIANITQALNDLYPQHPEISFSEDPELKRIQQIVMYKQLKSRSIMLNSPKNAKNDTIFNDAAEMILSGNSAVLKALLNQKKDVQEHLMEEMIAEGQSDSWFEQAVKDADIPDIKAKAHSDARENTLNNAFSPKVNVSELPRYFANSSGNESAQIRTNKEKHNADLEASKEKIKNTPLIIPAGENGNPLFNDREATIISFAEFFASNEMTEQYYEEARTFPGSTLPPETDPAHAGRTLIIEDVFEKDTRSNIGKYLIHVPKARTLAVQQMDDFGKGNREPLANTLKTCMNNALRFCRGTQDHMFSIYVDNAQIAAECATILERPEFKDAVKFTEIERKLAAVVKAQTKLRNELIDLKSKILRNLTENVGIEPADYLRNNEKDIRRYAALEMHMKQHNSAFSELSIASENLPAEERETLRQTVRISNFDRAAAADPEGCITSLCTSPEVNKIMEDILAQKSFDDIFHKLNSVSIDLGTIKEHTYLDIVDNMRVHSAVDRFENCLDEPDEYKSLVSKLKGLSGYKGAMPQDIPWRDVKSRIDEYKSALKYINDRYPDPIPGHEKSFMAGQPDFEYDDIKGFVTDDLQCVIENLETEKEFAAKRETEKFLDNLIKKNGKNVSLSFTGKDGNALSEEKAKLLLVGGGEVTVNIFPEGEPVGKSVRCKSGENIPEFLKVDTEKICTREVDLAESTKAEPTSQIEKLRHFRNILVKSDKFYFKNSGNFNNVMKSLDTVIKTQEALPSNANVKQIANIRSLYTELDEALGKYIHDKSEELSQKRSDLGQLRLDTIKSISKLTGKKHVTDVLCGLYPEGKKFADQSHEAAPINNLMKKWNNADISQCNPVMLYEFNKDFNEIAAFIRKQTVAEFQGEKDINYLRISMSMHTDDFCRMAAKLMKEHPEAEINQETLEDIKLFSKENNKAAKAFAELSGEINLKVKPAEKVKKNPEKQGMSL